MFYLACNEPAETCFCNWTGGGPHDATGADVFMVDIGGRLLLSAVSDTGRAFLEKGGLEEAGKGDREKAEELAGKAEQALPPPPAEDLAGAVASSWGSGLWEEVAFRCLSCYACAFTCPTCHCFDVEDECTPREGRRVRMWDACTTALFTLEASATTRGGKSASACASA